MAAEKAEMQRINYMKVYSTWYYLDIKLFKLYT